MKNQRKIVVKNSSLRTILRRLFNQILEIRYDQNFILKRGEQFLCGLDD